MAGIPENERPQLAAELKKLGSVKDVTTSCQNLQKRISGDNVWEPGKEDAPLNIANMNGCDSNFFSVLHIPLVQGTTFCGHADSTYSQIMVDEVLANEMKKHFGWNDNIVGHRIMVSGQHSLNPFTICGVFKHIRLGNICEEETRGGAVSYNPHILNNLYIRVHNTTSAENIAEIQKVVSTTFPGRDIAVYNCRTKIAGQYVSQRKFRDSVMVFGILTFITAFVGLVGYTDDEVNRRRKEIAIRKVNGARAGRIVMLFIKDILAISVPSLILGGIAANLVGHKWLSQFSEQVSLAPWLSTLCIAAILTVTLAVVILNCRRIAQSNPVDYLKSE